MRDTRTPFLVCAALLYVAVVGGCSDDPPTRPWRGWPATGTYEFVQAWGDSGSGNGQFGYPWGVAVGADGNLYVTDTGNDRIEVFTGTGTYLAQWGDSGSASGQFLHPMHVAVDAGGNVYVTDYDNHRVQKFASDGTYLAQWGTYGAANGQFLQQGGVAVDGNGNVYAADVTAQTGVVLHRIQVFTSDGIFLRAWGDTCRTIAPGNATHFPWDVAVDDSGNVYVADCDNLRIRKFTGTGAYITQWGTYGYGDGQFGAPEGVAVDAGGNVYVTDVYRDRVQKFTSTGTYITQWGSLGDGDGQFCAPRGIAVDADGNVYVVDACNRRIQKWAPRR